MLKTRQKLAPEYSRHLTHKGNRKMLENRDREGEGRVGV